jgi:hypothetical protein
LADRRRRKNPARVAKIMPAAHFWNELLPRFSDWTLGGQVGDLFILEMSGQAIFCRCVLEVPGSPLKTPMHKKGNKAVGPWNRLPQGCHSAGIAFLIPDCLFACSLPWGVAFPHHGRYFLLHPSCLRAPQARSGGRRGSHHRRPTQPKRRGHAEGPSASPRHKARHQSATATPSVAGRAAFRRLYLGHGRLTDPPRDGLLKAVPPRSG